MSTPTKLRLRDYQEEALGHVEIAEARGVLAQLGVAATGLGKTAMFCALAQRRGGRALILAHRDELVSQAATKVREWWPGVDVGIVKGAANQVRSQVVVASVQTLARPKRLAQLLEPTRPHETGWLTIQPAAAPFDLVVIDEAHHAAATSYRRIINQLRAGKPVGYCPTCETASELEQPDWNPDECPTCHGGELPRGPLLLGVTATPDRGDGKGLDDLFDEITFSYDILWGIRAGYLSDLRGKRVRLAQLDMSGVKVRRGDYDQGQAGAAMEDAGAPEAIVTAWLEHAEGRKTLVFTPTVALATQVAAEFVGAGVSAGWISGETPLEERRQTLRDFSAGRLDVLANCAVLTEGYDEPAVSCVVVARPTTSRALYVQMVGRGTRRHPDKLDCLVIDVVGATEQHNLVTVASLMGDEAKARRAKKDDDEIRSLVGAIEDDEAEQIRIGAIKAHDVELFHQVRREGIAWITVHQPDDELKRYVRPLGKGPDGVELPTVVLAERPGGTWTAGLQHHTGPTGRKEALVQRVTLEQAQGVAEDYVRRYQRATHLVATAAAWRGRKPSDKQLTLAAKHGIDVDPAWTAGELSDAITARVERRKLNRRA